jgi:hypothetical protein
MWRSILLSFLTGVTCLAASSDSPVGSWATQIVGRDHGICYLTFSNDTSVAGYGITLDRLGPFQMAGNWNLDEKGRLVGGFAVLDDPGIGAHFRGQVNNGKLRAKVNATQGRFNFKGDPAGDIPDVGGAWRGEVTVKEKKFFVDLTATLSTNTPAWFDLTGSGTNDDGSFAVTGGLVITPDGRVAAYIVTDTGVSTDTAAFIGKLRARGKKLVLRGRDESGRNVVIRASRAP